MNCFGTNLTQEHSPLQHSSDKDRYFNRVLSTQQVVDLIIVDVPKGLYMPIVSTLPMRL